MPYSRRLVEILFSLCGRLDISDLEIRDLQKQLEDLQRRHDDVATKLPATVAFGWDYVAMVRRLAVLEEHVDTLLNAREEAHDLARSAVVETPAPQPVRAKVG